MAFGIGEALSIGGSIAGGLFGDDANEDAADQIAASNAAIQAMIKEQQGSNDSAYGPYRNVGGAANSRLEYLLGLTDLSGGSRYDKQYGQLVDTSTGIPRPVASLYASDPKYKAAWDQFLNMNKAAYATSRRGGGNYTEDSDPAQIEAFIRSKLPGRNTFKDLTPDASYGSLLSKFSKGDLDSDVVYNTGLEFGLNEGVKGLNRRAASGGSYDSGATLKALTRYANDYGTTKAEGAYNRFMGDKATTYGFLSGQQGVGLNATDRNQSLNTDLVGRAVGAQQNSGAMQAQYGLQGAQALNNGIMGGIGNYLYSQRLGSGGGGVGTPGINGAASYPGYTYGNSSIPWYA